MRPTSQRTSTVLPLLPPPIMNQIFGLPARSRPERAAASARGDAATAASPTLVSGSSSPTARRRNSGTTFTGPATADVGGMLVSCGLAGASLALGVSLSGGGLVARCRAGHEAGEQVVDIDAGLRVRGRRGGRLGRGWGRALARVVLHTTQLHRPKAAGIVRRAGLSGVAALRRGGRRGLGAGRARC